MGAGSAAHEHIGSQTDKLLAIEKLRRLLLVGVAALVALLIAAELGGAAFVRP
jgi:hypothetical protein